MAKAKVVTMEEAQKKVAQYCATAQEVERAEVEYRARRAALIPPDLVLTLMDFDAEWATILENRRAKLAELEEDVKADVLALKETVEGDTVMFVWNKGRTTWDGKALDILSDKDASLLKYRKTGNPNVTVRGRGK